MAAEALSLSVCCLARGGGARTHFVASLSHLTIDHASGGEGIFHGCGVLKLLFHFVFLPAALSMRWVSVYSQAFGRTYPYGGVALGRTNSLAGGAQASLSSPVYRRIIALK